MKYYWIVFCQSEHWSQAFFKKGFGHCFVIYRIDGEWFILDPRRNRINSEKMQCDSTFDLPKFYSSQPFNKVVRVHVNNLKDKRDFLLRPVISLNCVNVVKYFCGLIIPGITPYRFYKALGSLSKNYLFQNNNIDLIKPIY